MAAADKAAKGGLGPIRCCQRHTGVARKKDCGAEDDALHGDKRAKGDDQRRHCGPRGQHPVHQTHDHADAKCARHADINRHAVMARNDRRCDRSRRDHRTDGNVDLARNHQHPHRYGDDPQIGREVQPAGRTGQCTQIDPAKDDVEGQNAGKAENGTRGRSAQKCVDHVHIAALISFSRHSSARRRGSCRWTGRRSEEVLR